MLSRGTSTELRVLKVTTDTETVKNLTESSRLSDIVHRYSGNVVNEANGKVGKVKNSQLKLNIKESINPVVQVRNTFLCQKTGRGKDQGVDRGRYH